jgi:D-alanyl-D-alanine carboxypeptidase
MTRYWRIAMLVLLCATARGRAQDFPLLTRVSTRVQQHLDSLHAGGHFAGAVVGVALPDGRSFAVATGFADTATRERMTVDHRLLSGSVGKTYVAAVTMLLIQQGAIELDTPVSRYLGREPWFPRLPNARDITVRQLMTHTSGLPRYEFTEAFTRDLTNAPSHVWRPEQLLSYILGAKPAFEAGDGWEYSDTNYIVLGMIIERVTGRRYYDVLLERIVAPLQLTNTVPGDNRRIANLAQGYAGPRNPFGGKDAMLDNGEMIINPQFEWTGGGIASTAEDLARWGKLLFEGQAFDPALLPQFLEGVPARLGPNTRYGLGLIIRETPLGPTYGHSGFFPGYQAELVYLPTDSVAVAFQVNSSVPGALGRSPVQVAQEFLEIAVSEIRRGK